MFATSSHAYVNDVMYIFEVGSTVDLFSGRCYRRSYSTHNRPAKFMYPIPDLAGVHGSSLTKA
jgi:hypothetical protein